jgi:hypothetical protein
MSYVLAASSDGYRALCSLAELDPELTPVPEATTRRITSAIAIGLVGAPGRTLGVGLR